MKKDMPDRFPKTILSIFLAILILSMCCEAKFDQSALYALDQKLQKLISPYGKKAGIYFIDLESGIEFGINGRNKFPAASVAKVPVMATAFHLAESGLLNFNKKIVFREKDKLPGSGVLRWMRANRQYSLSNLVRLMIVLSDNTATRLVIDQIGLMEINNYMEKVGLKNTIIVDNTMLREAPEGPINLTTPEDMARLWTMIKKSHGFNSTSSQQMLAYMRKQRYRWGIWKGVPKGIEVANKTGNLDGILNDAGLVYAPSGNYVLSIFTQGFSKKRNARKLINKISEIVYQLYQK